MKQRTSWIGNLLGRWPAFQDLKEFAEGKPLDQLPTDPPSRQG